jgi:WD40 repeat protein
MDIRNTTVPIFSLSAHNDAVTGMKKFKIKINIYLKYLGLCLSTTVPGFLVTSSFDESIKVWDIENNNVTFIAERQFQTVIFFGGRRILFKIFS